jgi:hypothetical protein
MIPLSDLRLMQVKVSPLGVSGDKIMAERLDMLEGCGEMPYARRRCGGFLFCGSRMSAMSGEVSAFLEHVRRSP